MFFASIKSCSVNAVNAIVRGEDVSNHVEKFTPREKGRDDEGLLSTLSAVEQPVANITAKKRMKGTLFPRSRRLDCWLCLYRGNFRYF